ncbi:MAG: LacI family transcriptional regulator [Phycisphaerae bacterium]|nr:LacI family transcriptional regulator [Phycisphaerae bacterium]
MTIKQKQIAEKLNVSICTVSRSLRGLPDIHPDTRKKVVEMASELGYQPNFRRQSSAATEKLVTFGVIVYEASDRVSDPSSGANHMLVGIGNAASELGVSLDIRFITEDLAYKVTDLREQFPAMRAGMMSGLILVYDCPHEMLREFKKQLPCVTIHHPHLGLGIDCIDNGQADGVGEVLEHLYDLGHRRIGFFSLPRIVGTAWLFPRFSGYMRAMRRLSLPLDTSLVYNVFDPLIENDELADAIVEHYHQGVTAWICADGGIGHRMYPYLVSRGLRIPQDISLAGFNGLTVSGKPMFTSVRLPFEQMGATAVKQMLYRIEHPDEPASHILIGCEFVKGETTGPPHGADQINK